ncbi:MAG: trk system potassium uptake protein TrkH [Desulforhopalus sp.]|jgi:trk system potassium uptake protein TrkH
MRLPLLASALAIVLFAFGSIILLPVIMACFEREYWSTLPFLVSSVTAVSCGLLLHWYGRKSRNFDLLTRNEALFIVTATWIVCGIIGGIPYLFFGLSPLDALFESVSGITTTGATILIDFSLYSKTFYFWRALSQWLGGMGIIVLFVAILPQFGVAGRKIFFAEAPGPTEEKITPRITHTAKALWFIYLLLTCAEIIALTAAGMDFDEAICNSLATMAAGGFSPNPQSIMGYQSSAITWIITFFMLLAGSNFALQYRMLIKRHHKALFASEEFRFYLIIVFLFSAGLSLILYFSGSSTIVDAIRDSLFQIVSIITTAGFSSADFALWTIPAQTLIFTMMLIGGCAGSAGGGVKVVRILFIFKFLKREIDQLLHPNAVLPIKIDRVTVHDDVQRQMLSFLLFYLLLMVFSGLIVTMIEHDAAIGLVGTAATIGNVGPGFGEIGPMGSFGNLHSVTKILFIVDMFVGRLELIPFIIMLSPDFWHIAKN